MNREAFTERVYRLVTEVLPRNMEVPHEVNFLIEELADELEASILDFEENENDSQLYL